MRLKREYIAQAISVLSAVICALLAGCKFAASGLVVELNPTSTQVEKGNENGN